MQIPQRNRAGFTIVELLVAAALSLAIMSIIAVGFQKGLDTFRVLHSVAKMQTQLKAAQAVLTSDLTANHFSNTTVAGAVNTFGPQLRDQRLDQLGWVPPDEGFFRIIQMAPSNNDGTVDSDGLPSYYSQNHALHFTAKLGASSDDQMFYSSTAIFNAQGNLNITNFAYPPDFQKTGTYASQWAEIYYFLQPNTGVTANGTQLNTLYRRQCLVLPKGAPNATSNTTYADISWNQSTPTPTPGTNTVNTSDQVTNPSARGLQASSIAPVGDGSDILLTNVLSFEVKAYWVPGAGGVSKGAELTQAPAPQPRSTQQLYAVLPATQTQVNNDWPFTEFPASPWNANGNNGILSQASAVVFDTWSQQSLPATWNANTPATWATGNPTSTLGVGNGLPPLRVRITTLQIRIRIWDPNTQQARQITMVQEI